jgi:hypothetical protein
MRQMLGLAAVDLAEPGVTPGPVDVFCYRPAARDFSCFEARLREVVAQLPVGTRLVFASSASARQAGVYVSPCLPTVVALVQGRLAAQAVGELPIRELRALLLGAVPRP